MKIAGSVALVTGANRGLGRAHTREQASRGAAKALVGERTRAINASLSRDHELIYPAVQEFWDAAIQGRG